MTKPLVVCIKVGDKYGPEYVNKLGSMLARHTTLKYDFVCLTDDARGLNVPVHSVETALSGWWAKLVLFKPHSLVAGRRTIFLDLDTVIVSNVDWLFAYDNSLCMVNDWCAKSHNSSVMSIDGAHDFSHVWKRFHQSKEEAMCYPGDQDWISEHVSCDLWPDWLVGSYKFNNLEDDPKGFPLVCFHGEPKPAEFKKGWVYDNWR